MEIQPSPNLFLQAFLKCDILSGLKLIAGALDPGGPSDLMSSTQSGLLRACNALASWLNVILPSTPPGRTFGKALYLSWVEQQSILSRRRISITTTGKLDLLASNGAFFSNLVCGTPQPNLLSNIPPTVEGTLITSPQPSLAGEPYTATATLSPTPSQAGTIAGTVKLNPRRDPDRRSDP